VAGADRLEPAPDQGLAKLRVIAQAAERGRHLLAISHHQKVVADPEQAFAILPWRGDEWDAAGERLEDADGRDAG
jgi:hypothetical protein